MEILHADKNRRVLVIDDNPAIHQDFRKILSAGYNTSPELDAAEAAVFGPRTLAPTHPGFEMDSAFLGQDGVMLAIKARQQERPYAVAYLDVRMPPGWDGLETLNQLWDVDPDLQIVICTAYSDYSWRQLFESVTRPDQVMVLKKPFDPVEALQMAHALTEKWNLQRASHSALKLLESRVAERTAELRHINRTLQVEVTEHQRTEDALRRQQAELRVLFDLIPAMIWFKDAQGRILRVNRLAAEVAGRPVREIEGRTSEEIYPQQALRFHADDLEVIRSGAPKLAVVHTSLDADGARRWVQTDKVPYFDQAGEVIGIVVVARDITAHKQQELLLQQSEQRMRATIESALDCIISMSADGRITEFNPAAEQTFGFRRADIIGRTLGDTIVPPALQASHIKGLQRYLACGSSNLIGRRVELSAVHADGREIPIELSITAVDTGPAPTFTGFLRDITVRKESELKISRINRALRVLSACNEALVRAEDEQRLLQDICRMVVDIGGYVLAGVGYAMNDERRSIAPMAQAGGEPGFLDQLKLSWDENQPNGRGPAGRTIRDGQAVVIENIATDPTIFHWRDASIERGYRSLVSLPLRNGQITFGLLALYSTEIFSSGTDEITLLQDLADNLSFGICNLRARIERQQAHEARGRMERALEESLMRQQSLSRRLVEVQEADQRLLSGELHDRIGQNLTALSLNLKIIGELMPSAADAISARIEDSRKVLETTMTSVRNLISELRPTVLDDYGLLAGLRWYCEQVQARTGMTATVSGSEPHPRLPPAIESTLFRIVQEAMTNTIKHAQARNAKVQLTCADGRITVTVADDGTGFDPAALDRPGPRINWGLEMMRERADSAGARLQVESAPGCGTRIVVDLAQPA